MKTEIDNLLARYFGGNASKDDMNDLEKWISSSTENQLFFDKTTILYEKLNNTSIPNIPKSNTLAAKRKFMAHIDTAIEDKKNVNIEIKHIAFYKKWMFQAASVAILILLSFAGWNLFLPEQEMVLSTKSTIKQYSLVDKTQVKLFKNSKITYSSDFGKNNKIIKLEGEANFTVGHKGDGKLQIQAGETFIEDIGTVFSVTAYPDRNYISVKVSEGEVKFYTKKDKGIMLKSNETGLYNKTTKNFRVLDKKTKSKEAVGSMHIEFQGMMLNDAIDIISNAYNVGIKLSDKSIGYRKITVNFDGEDVNMVLEIIAETLNLHLKREANTFTLSNKTISK